MELELIPILRLVVLGLLFAPLVAALIVCRMTVGVRRLSQSLALMHLVLMGGVTAIVSADLTTRGESQVSSAKKEYGFRPFLVPGDPGTTNDPNSQSYETSWDLLPLAEGRLGGPPTAIQFYFGLDGLNIWLVLLTSLMTMIAMLVAWDTVTERPAAFYAWLFVLQTAITATFMAFDVILFYICFELTLIPCFFLIGHWGDSNRREAARKFFLYTLLGGLITLTGLIGLIITNPTPVQPNPPTGEMPREYYTATFGKDGELLLPTAGPITTSLPRLMQNVRSWAVNNKVKLGLTWDDVKDTRKRADEAAAKAAAAPSDAALRSAAEAALKAAQNAESRKDAATEEYYSYRTVQNWLFFLVMAGFVVKVPLVPFHTWLPLTYRESPIALNILLSALLAKLGTYGMLRVVVPLCPDAVAVYGLPVFGTLGAIGLIYGAFCAFGQSDLKALTAYSSLSHLGFLVVGIFTATAAGFSGAALHMVNHGLSTGAMFGLLGFLLARYRTLDMNLYSGLLARYPGYSFLMFVIVLASIGLPGLNNLVSEMLMLGATFDPINTRQVGYGLAVAGGVGILLSAWYMLTMLRRVFFGPAKEPPTTTAHPANLNGREMLAYATPALLCLVLGIYPQPILDTMKADIGTLTQSTAEARDRLITADDERVLPADRVNRPDAPIELRQPMKDFKGPDAFGGGKGKGGPPQGKFGGKGGPPQGKFGGKGGPPQGKFGGGQGGPPGPGKAVTK